MSLLQFHKQIRLQEARRMMLGEDLDATSAGLRVGYENPSSFSSEYKKLFGSPPRRDIASLRSNLERQEVAVERMLSAARLDKVLVVSSRCTEVTRNRHTSDRRTSFRSLIASRRRRD